MTDNTVEVRLPARPEYVSVLRAAVGVIAGSMSFNYDEILHLRVAVSEAFSLALKHAKLRDGHPEVSRMSVSFMVAPGELEIRVTDPDVDVAVVAQADEAESRAVLESLVDRVEFRLAGAGESVISLVKYLSADQL